MRDSSFQQMVGEAIASQRRQLRLSVGELASSSGVDPGTVSRAENGLTSITLSTSIALCKVLHITPSQLIPNMIGEGTRQDAWSAKDSRVGGVINADAATLLALFRSNVDTATDLLVGWLDMIARYWTVSVDKTDASISFDRHLLRLLISKQGFFRFRIQYPHSSRVWALLNTYMLSGIFGRGELRLFLSGLADDAGIYQRLDRQNKEILRRLISDTPDRVRLYDVVNLSLAMNLDLVDIYWCAETSQMRDQQQISPDSPRSHEEAMLITLFMAICAWFDELQRFQGFGLTAIRQGMQDLQLLAATVRSE